MCKYRQYIHKYSTINPQILLRNLYRSVIGSSGFFLNNFEFHIFIESLFWRPQGNQVVSGLLLLPHQENQRTKYCTKLPKTAIPGHNQFNLLIKFRGGFGKRIYLFRVFFGTLPFVAQLNDLSDIDLWIFMSIITQISEKYSTALCY